MKITCFVTCFRNLLLAGVLLTLAATSPRLLAADTNTAAKAVSPALLLTDKNSLAKAVPDLLKTCPVSGDNLGEMGDPFRFSYKGQEVKLCCSGCKKDFLKDPEKYLALIRKADKKSAK